MDASTEVFVTVVGEKSRRLNERGGIVSTTEWSSTSALADELAQCGSALECDRTSGLFIVRTCVPGDRAFEIVIVHNAVGGRGRLGSRSEWGRLTGGRGCRRLGRERRVGWRGVNEAEGSDHGTRG